jgi:hypothetical protein
MHLILLIALPCWQSRVTRDHRRQKIKVIPTEQVRFLSIYTSLLQIYNEKVFYKFIINFFLALITCVSNGNRTDHMSCSIKNPND